MNKLKPSTPIYSQEEENYCSFKCYSHSDRFPSTFKSFFTYKSQILDHNRTTIAWINSQIKIKLLQVDHIGPVWMSLLLV